MTRELTVGMVLFALVAGLLAMTLWIRDPGFLDQGARHQLKASFREVPGLDDSSKVWVYGTEAGRVTGIAPDGKGGVEVTMLLDYDPDIREDAVIEVRAASALGRAVVSIHPGTPDSPEATEAVLPGRVAGDALVEVGRLASELRGPLMESVENIRKISGDLAERSDEIVANIDEFAQNARDISRDLRDGRGTVGKLLTDDTLYNDLEAAVASLKKLGEDVDGGGGTIDLLLHDKEMAADLKETFTNIREVSAKLSAGEGSLGKLLNDPALYDDLAATAADLREITGAAREGDGVLGRLIYDDELGDRLDRITRDISQVTGKLRRGEGTLGRLIQDEELYEELRDGLRSLTAGAGDARENAPILTFAAFLFGSF
jgi:phospholipid/cholesterol/gamma-HCH transport system substrate-binding protein